VAVVQQVHQEQAQEVLVELAISLQEELAQLVQEHLLVVEEAVRATHLLDLLQGSRLVVFHIQVALKAAKAAQVEAGEALVLHLVVVAMAATVLFFFITREEMKWQLNTNIAQLVAVTTT
jgi:hypothetical protein